MGFNKIRYYKYKATVWGHYQFHNIGTDDNEIPRDFTPAIPVRTRNGRQQQIPFTQLYPFPRPMIEHGEPETVRHMIRHLHPSLKSLVQTVEQLATKAEIVNVIASRKFILIPSNSGAIPGRALYAWILQIGNI
jgi:hypothetical protein